jgi:hypothetical protein
MNMLAEKRFPGIFLEGAATFSILDGASIPDLLTVLHELRPDYECLFRGELKPDMAEVAPYLVQLEPESEFTDWVLEKGWGNHWGVLVTSSADLRALHRHFRTILVVHDPEGKPLYFRYYDPRVLRIYLPTCNGDQLKEIFGPVESYVMENEDVHEAVLFRLAGGKLEQEVTKVEEA